MDNETKALPIALLDPLVSRVRTDVHWRRKPGNAPVCIKQALDGLMLGSHLNGGIARGCCPVKAGESTTMVAVLDLDSHKGETSWELMLKIADSLGTVLLEMGVETIPFSSSGGKGIHLYMVWDTPQDAYSVRSLLREALGAHGYSDGAGGVSKNQVEIFPKQDSVPLDGFGNMFILPYSGESVPLEPQLDYQRMPKDYAVEWPVSASVPVIQKPEASISREPIGISGRLVGALDSIDVNLLSYGDWLRIGQAIHHETSGDVNGYLLWDKWSSLGGDYPGQEETDYKWSTFGKASSEPVKAGSLFKLAVEHGWVDMPTVEDFEDISNDPDIVIPIPGNPLRFAAANALTFSAGKPTPWIVKGVLPEADLTVLYGESGSGKSFFALDLICSIVRGLPWRGRRVRQGKVVYLIAEGSGGFRNRINAYVSRHGLTELDLDVISAAPNFLEKRDVLDVIASVSACGDVSLVVVDTWAQVTPGSNENSGEDMGKALMHCRKIRQETGAMVLLVHHSGKDSTRGARGWSGLRAAADCEIAVTRDGEYRVATITKLKDGDDGPQFGFKLTAVVVGEDEDGDPVTSCVVDEAEVSAVSKTTNRKRKTGDNENALRSAVSEYFEEKGEWPDVNTLLESALLLLPEASTRASARKGNLNRSLKTLIDDEILFEKGGFVSDIDQNLDVE